MAKARPFLSDAGTLRAHGRAILLPALLLAFGLQSQTSASSFFSDFHAVTSIVENSCLATTASTNGDDCSYNASKPGGRGSTQWIGPTFSAGYYASDTGLTQFSDPAIATPVTAPVPILPLGGKEGIPVTGYIEIRDSGTPANPADDLIAGSLTLGPFDRNVSMDDGTPANKGLRGLEHFKELRLTINAKIVSSAMANAAGGFDYVVGLGIPPPLAGSTTANGFADTFPSEVASQSSPDAGDVGYWTTPGSLGIASFEGNVGTSTLPAAATVYTCKTGTAAAQVDCTPGPLNWNTPVRARFENVLVKVSTDATGVVTAGTIVLVNEFQLLPASTADDSWQALTLDISSAALRPTAVDDAAPLNGSNSVIVDVLANDLNLSNTPVTVVQSVGPKHGSIVINPDNTVTYTPASGTIFDTFQYTIRNASGFSSATALVKLGNDLPVAHDDLVNFQKATLDDKCLATLTVDYQTNDTGLGDTPITATIVGAQPAHGEVSVTPGTASMIYKSSGIFPTDRFAYQITDSNGDSSTASVVVRGLKACTDGDQTATKIDTVAGYAKNINVLANDVARTDSPVVLSIATPPQHGKATVNPDNTITYTSDPDFRGRFFDNGSRQECLAPPRCGDVFQYSIRNAEGDTAIGIVGVNVYPPPTTKKGSALDPWSLAALLTFATLRLRPLRRSRSGA